MAPVFETVPAEPVESEAPVGEGEAVSSERRRLPRAECQERSRSWWRHRHLVLRRRR